MRNISLLLVMTVFILFCSGLPTTTLAQETTREIKATGLGENEEMAIAGACKSALSLATGNLADSLWTVQHYLELEDEIFSRYQYYISGYEIVSAEKRQDGIAVTVTVKINESALIDKLRRMNTIGPVKLKLRVGVAILAPGESDVYRQTLESSIISQASSKGYCIFLDHHRLKTVNAFWRARHEKLWEAAIDGRKAEALLLMEECGLDYLITGKAHVLRPVLLPRGVYSCQTQIEAAMLERKTGKVVAEWNEMVAGRDKTEETAIKKSLQMAGWSAGRHFTRALMEFK